MAKKQQNKTNRKKNKTTEKKEKQFPPAGVKPRIINE